MSDAVSDAASQAAGTAVPTARIRAALARAGVLVGERGSLPATLAGITDDSRQVRAGHCFVAVRGSARDGHAFLAAAATAGAAAVIVEDPEGTALPAFVVRDGRAAAAATSQAAECLNASVPQCTWPDAGGICRPGLNKAPTSTGSKR